MATIAGPNVSMPSTLSKLQRADGNVSVEWAAFFNALQQIAFDATRSGPTASRPTDALKGRWIGMPYFDTTLGIPIWLQSVGPPDVWVDATGAPV